MHPRGASPEEILEQMWLMEIWFSRGDILVLYYFYVHTQVLTKLPGAQS